MGDVIGDIGICQGFSGGGLTEGPIGCRIGVLNC